MDSKKSKNNSGESETPRDFYVGLDIGTSKVCALIAQPDRENDSLKILGVGSTKCGGLNRGVVANIDRTVAAIKESVETAEKKAGVKVSEVTVGVAGDHIESYQSRGKISISNENNVIDKDDLERLVEDARSIGIPPERTIIHIIPQDFIIDGQDGIADPIGMSGVRMEANVHVVTGLKTAIQNIYTCVERAGLHTSEVVLEPLASGESVLTEEEKEVGVALIDIGGGTTDIAIFDEKVIRFTKVIALAGQHVTDDIKKGFGIIPSFAEEIKLQYGHAHYGSIMEDKEFMIPGVGGRKPIERKTSELCSIIQPRMEEIFEFALGELRNSGYMDRLGAGIVLTGGCSMCKGAEELAEEVFETPIKIGLPSSVDYSGLGPEVNSPVYSTAVGLAMRAIKRAKKTSSKNARTNRKIKNGSNNGSFLTKIKNFIEEL